MTAAFERPVAVLLTPVLPQPGGSGRALRAWDWLIELAATHEVHVWSAEPTPALPSGWPSGARLWPSDADLLPVSRGLRRLGWAFPWLCGMLPRAAAGWLAPAASPPGLAALAAAIGTRRVARLVVFRLYLDGVAQWVRSRLAVDHAELDLDDLDSATARSVAGALWRLGQPLDAVLAWRDAQQFRRLEDRIPARYGRLWFAAHDDVGASASMHARVRPNRLYLRAPWRDGVDRPGLGLLFVGSLEYPPNEEAALFLARRVVPLLLDARMPQPWALTVAGRCPPARLRERLAQCAQVRLAADTQDLPALYADASIAVLPLFAGGGTKFKTLEALAHGLAVVATGEAVRGLDVRDGEHFLRAETAAQFAQAVVALSASPALRDRLARAGQAWSRARVPGAGLAPQAGA